MSFAQPPLENLRHGDILGYYLGYRVANSTDPFRYQTLEHSGTRVRQRKSSPFVV